MSIVRLAVCVLLCGVRLTSAHPVAQGSMRVVITPHTLTVHANVTLEEVLVASAYGPETSRNKTAAEAAQLHGPYLLNHLKVSADGRPLHGHLLPTAEAQSHPNRVSYVFEFALEKPASEFRFEEDVLNEFDFAPGNRWEASYVVSIAEEGRAPREGLLFTSRQPLVYQVERTGASSNSTPQLDRWRVIRDYLHHGVLHILTGYDHLLFVTALVLAVRSLWELVKVISAFTLAHSITLTLSAFDLVRLPSRVVEPMIAASIVFVALQNVFWPARTRGWSRLGVAFFFGLFHGLGFAGGLLDAMQGMTTNALVLALLGFSVGVEIGHQIVVLPTFAVLKVTRSWRADSVRTETRTLIVSRSGSVAIAVAGLAYLVIALRAW